MRFVWVEGEFDASGELTGVVCQSCTIINGQRKVMVPKGDNLKKREDKRTHKKDGVPLANLKKGDIHIKLDSKHLKFIKLWAGRKQETIVA